MTLNVQMSLRPKLRALDVLIRAYQYPLTLHVQEAGPLIIQTVHPLYHTIQAPAKVAGGCAALLYKAPAQEGRREPDDSLQGDLMRACRAMAGGHPPPPPPLLPHHRHLARRPTGPG